MIPLALLIAYFLGSIPFGLVITRLAGLGDIRTIGSGNIGATNVMRTGHKLLGINTLVLDAVKGVLAVEIAKEFGLSPEWIYACALACVLGHVFPLWLKFKGGKGVATALGVIFALSLTAGIVFCVFWLIGYFWTKIVSVASLEAIWLIIPFNTNHVEDLFFYLLLAILISYTHRANIKRLKEGTESSFRKEKK